MIERKDIPKLSANHTPVLYENYKYTLSGYQVYYKGRDTIYSVVLVDERGCLLWVDYKKIELIGA